MPRVINLCFSCRFGWLGEETGKALPCPKCHGANTSFTKELKTAEPRLGRQAFEELVAAALKDPELKKLNAAYLPLFWKLKRC
ncbi:MAG: hypothetical protein NTY90_02820 [Candidatus Micrarchaeota archaeon]|nr:hypothetical protein [Candidatus Micrarchaeota archaeon]